MSPLGPPVRATGDGFVVALDPDEAALVRRLVAELRTMLTDDDPDPATQALLARLFPVAHPDDPEAESEYQRLMRDELVLSKLAAFDIVDRALADGGQPIDADALVAFMQALNSLRLVLGTMLEVSDDPEAPEVRPGLEDSPEYALYGFLSYLLDHSVRALTRSPGV